MQVGNVSNVFDHDANPERVTALRDAVVDDITSLHDKYPDFCKLTAADLNSDDYAQMRKKYPLLLQYGHFGLPKGRPVVNELIWKWTEATGKYVGCQYWSVKAKELFDLEVKNSGGWPMSAERVRSLEKRLRAKSRPDYLKLTHEHVYPIKDMKRWLGSQTNFTREEIQRHFKRHCVSCVVLESEHDRSVGSDENPWLRYKQVGIYLAANSAWLDIQRSLILQAGLIAQS